MHRGVRLGLILVGLIAALAAAATWATANRGEERRALPTLSGQFDGFIHPTSGRARLASDEAGGRTLVLRGFKTHPAPDLYIYLVPGGPKGGEIGGGTNLGRLKLIEGDQHYRVPAAFQSERASVVIWCAVCEVPFGHAPLQAL